MKSTYLIWAGTILVWGIHRSIPTSILMIISSVLVLWDIIPGLFGRDQDDNEEDE